MKLISSLIISFSLLAASAGIAATTTSLSSNWTCKTNASSSSVAEEQSADKQMSENAKSATDAFNYAAKNCRDCTKITCQSNS